jgi:hypothetical protein
MESLVLSLVLWSCAGYGVMSMFLDGTAWFAELVAREVRKAKS